MVLVAILAAAININASVPALLPVVVVLAVRLGHPPSQLLMPLAFAASAGSLLALTGSPVNAIVSDAAADAGVGAIGFLEFALVGSHCCSGRSRSSCSSASACCRTASSRSMPADLSGHARTLVEQYRLDDGLFNLRVRPASPYVGAPRRPIDLTGYPGVDAGRHPGRGRGPAAATPRSPTATS